MGWEIKITLAVTTSEHLPPVLEVDELASSSSDCDGESLASSTVSLTESINEHVYANGRRYHRKSEGQYALPSDETEMNRLDLVHLQLLTLGGDLHKAPIQGDPLNVLDCGTGTGIWALDFGDLHKGSRVLGVDLIPNQPTWTFPNVTFEIDDVEKPWTYSQRFDFIHSRHLATSIRDWPSYLTQIFTHLTPGGFVEISEHNLDTLHSDDATLPPTSPLLTYMSCLRSGLLAAGVNPDLQGADYKRMLEEAGFVDVQLRAYKIPWGAWAKNRTYKMVGAILGDVAATGIEAHGLQLMTAVLGMTEGEARRVCGEAVEGVRTGREHAYHWQWQVWGRKPVEGEE
ncbi:S-adenosyl-L-methionine-dependent methyltransferase [Ascodesmis nigricans]|uniref:S-adenosyl-L-methionine-dependent methyltransferase n=1 Tax=Ascodesmis nigricans TaxID=341454 RepID=A0A4S2MKL7_9PEZI|nr:S-adenosyl-L-methionine-dependent methyltransferase [Ascodesmis nigricans]